MDKVVIENVANNTCIYDKQSSIFQRDRCALLMATCEERFHSFPKGLIIDKFVVALFVQVFLFGLEFDLVALIS